MKALCPDRIFLAVSCWLTAWSSGQESPKTEAAAQAVYGPAKLLGKVDAPALKELSGLAPSRRTPGFWWTHNDSGNAAELYALDDSGHLTATVKITGAPNNDWEDLAGYSDNQGRRFLFIADSGDPPKRKAGLALLRIEEPAIKPGVENAAASAEVFPFRYPDGVFDCEALVVDPLSGRPYLFTKTRNPLVGASVYRFPMPLRPGEEVVLEKVAKEKCQGVGSLSMVTGAAAAPDGKRLAIRTYTGVFEFLVPQGGSWEDAFQASRHIVDIPFLLQSEAVAYTSDGLGIVTTREGASAELYQVRRETEPSANSRPDSTK